MSVVWCRLQNGNKSVRNFWNMRPYETLGGAAVLLILFSVVLNVDFGAVSKLK